MSLEERWQRDLDALESFGCRRSLTPPGGVDFSSNDYLGYGRCKHREVPGLSRSGTASRLLRGQHPLWDDVETLLAQWHGAEAALVMTSGYVANLGLLATIVGPSDVVFSDAANHASIIDGLRGVRRKRIFQHNDLAHLEDGLRASARERGTETEVFIVTESLFSMEGDVAPLTEMTALAEKHDAHLVVDEAHATGCFSATGSGLVDALGLRQRVLATVHTGGKALGVPGAYIVGSALLKEQFVNRCRHFVYTTALPPQIAAWWLETIPRVGKDASARKRLHDNARRLRAAFAEAGVESRGEHYIVPVVVGDAAKAVLVAERIQEQGFDIRAIRPPTVPKSASRLRVSIHADHDADQIDRAARCVAAALREQV